MVDREQLEQYAIVQQEIKSIQLRIEKMRKELQKLENMQVSDSVACGKRGKKPLKTVKITGKPVLLIEKKKQLIAKNVSQLEKLEIKLLEKQCEVEQYIETIQKSEMREIFRHYYIDGYSYVKTAKYMNQKYPHREIKYTDENIKKKLQRFFEKN